MQHTGGAPWGLEELAGDVVVLTFLRPYDDARWRPGRELLARIHEAARRLRPDVRARTAVVVALLDGPVGQVPAGIDPGWRLVDAPAQELHGLAARAGVLTWSGLDDGPGQSFVTLVVDGRRRIAERFIGLDDWTAADLVGAIVVAADR